MNQGAPRRRIVGTTAIVSTLFTVVGQPQTPAAAGGLALPARYRTLRIKFLLKQITEDEWRATLGRLSKKAEKDAAVEQIMRMLVDVGTDLLRRAVRPEHKDDEPTIKDQLEALRRYANSELAKVAAQFHNKVPLIYLHRRAQQWALCGIGMQKAPGWVL